ncbi:hypothetical protein AB5J49_37230 [Streptomyces sp. R28]|uniref:Uncharacterized protein n=1 Tax=Streptomyces sp. R28 TaxID=3238628 RepID=A0AB39Q8D9_9ACTN
MIRLTGPLLPVMSFVARLPTATIRFGSVLLVARTSGSLTAAGLTGGALAIGQAACGSPCSGRWMRSPSSWDRRWSVWRP